MTNKLIIWTSLALAFLIIGMFGGLHLGRWSASRSTMIAEYKVHYFNYKQAKDNPQLQEYLKSRMYFLACFLDRRDLDSFNVDLGPVANDKLNGISGIKGPETEEENYQCAIRKHKK